MDVISAMARGARRDGAMARLRVVVSSVLISVHYLFPCIFTVEAGV